MAFSQIFFNFSLLISFLTLKAGLFVKTGFFDRLTAPDTEAESLKSEILKIDDEINQLMEKMAYADSVVFEYIQGRINTLHSKKTEIERKLQTRSRKKKAVENKPLEEPLKNWEKMTIQQQHDVAATIIDCVYISHNSEEIEIRFSI